MDKELRYQLLKASTRDRKFLRECAKDLSPEFFPTREEQAVAEAASTFYQKYEDPIGPLLRTEVDDIATREKFGSDTKTKLKQLVDHLQGTKMELVSVGVLTDKLKALKKHAFYDNAVDEILTAKEEGKFGGQLLSDIFDKFRRELDVNGTVIHNYMDDLEDRIARRSKQKDRFPLLLIEPIDKKTDVIGRGMLGLVMAPPGGGKGLALVKISSAYALQGLKVLHITLEDPKSLVEDRLDASFTGVSLTRLKHLPKTFRKRFKRIKEQMRGRLKIIDGTGDDNWTVTKIEKTLEQAKREDFIPDAVIVDYDDELVCEKKFTGESARRFEFSEIYKRLRKLAADQQIMLWTAAQTGRSAVGKQMITSREIAEDFSKIRKVFFAMSIGSMFKGAAEHQLYLYIMKNRLGGRAGFGVDIMSDFDCGLLYDPEATRLFERKKRLEQKHKATK